MELRARQGRTKRGMRQKGLEHQKGSRETPRTNVILAIAINSSSNMINNNNKAFIMRGNQPGGAPKARKRHILKARIC